MCIAGIHKSLTINWIRLCCYFRLRRGWRLWHLCLLIPNPSTNRHASAAEPLGSFALPAARDSVNRPVSALRPSPFTFTRTTRHGSSRAESDGLLSQRHSSASFLPRDRGHHSRLILAFLFCLIIAAYMPLKEE